MSIIDKFFSHDCGDETPCKVSGHDWKETGVSGYYTNGVPHFGRGDSWTVEKKLRKECKKCGTVDFHNEKVGRIKVDKNTDELQITHNKTHDA